MTPAVRLMEPKFNLKAVKILLILNTPGLTILILDLPFCKGNIMGPKKPTGKAESKVKRKVPEAPVPLPDWPILQPLLPTTDLSLETLLEEQIIVIRNFFTSTLCKEYVAFLSSLPLVTTPAKPKQGDAVRVNDRLRFDDPSFAEQLWSSAGLKFLVNGSPENNCGELTPDEARRLWGGEVCGLNPRIRIYRYGTYVLYVIPLRKSC